MSVIHQITKKIQIYHFLTFLLFRKVCDVIDYMEVGHMLYGIV